MEKIESYTRYYGVKTQLTLDIIGNSDIQTKEIFTQHRRITETVILLTILFFVCNTTYSVFWVLVCYNYIDVNNSGFPWAYTMAIILPFVNATLNPIILISRASAMRTIIKEKMSSIFNMFKYRKSNYFQRSCRDRIRRNGDIMGNVYVIDQSNSRYVVKPRPKRNTEISLLNESCL